MTWEPPRSTTSVIVWPADWRISGVTWSQVETGVPFTETMRSPFWRPATAAGEAGSPATHAGWGWATVGAVDGTQVATVEMSGVAVGMP